MKQNKVFTYGRHALSEALKYAPHAVTKVYLDNKSVDTKLRGQIDRLGIPVAKLSEGMARSDLKSGVAHQGIIGSISLFALVQPFVTFAETLSATKDTALVLLDGVQDPQNVGAIIRTAAGFGASAVLLPEHGTAPVTGTVIKVSAGMAFRIPLVSVGSAKQTLVDLKKRGYKVYGLAADGGATPLPQARFDAPAVFILGNEGAGIADDIRKLCDEVLAIPMDPRCESLNVAAAAAVTLYAWHTGRAGQA
ncbi:RNA methyltransferase [Candidatus Kaiserbacteria bacterium]|nr:RNA methyltransferase [Candidatus Kaiserbacteria bacterium]